MTTGQAANRLRIRPRDVAALCDRGLIAASLDSRGNRVIDPDSVEAWAKLSFDERNRRRS